MSSRDYIKHLVANTSSLPGGRTLGDEVFDPTTNKLFKTIAANGRTVSIVQIPYIEANTVLFTGSGSIVLNTSPTISSQTINSGYTEQVFALSGATPAIVGTNGSIQTWTLPSNSTPTSSLTTGQSITLMITAGAFTITWPSVTWKTGAGTAPTLQTSGVTAIQLWNVGGVLYGARVGNN